MTLQHLPNAITVVRFLMVPPVAWAIAQAQYAAAFALFLVAGLSDGVDGYLAKRYGWHSRLGAILDPLADKALMVVCFVALAWQGLLPPWLVALVILRDVVIVGGAVAFQIRMGDIDIHPTWMSKLNTLVQIVLVVLVMFGQAFAPLPDALLATMMSVVVLATFVSGIDYVLDWSRRAAEGPGR
jgi:cardiolipin synthase